MKLTELNPKWVASSAWGEKNGQPYQFSTYERNGMGLVFDCPVHRDHRIVVFFANPIDALPPAEDKFLWQRSGDTFESITLTPSVDASHAQGERTGCWHGHITNGEVK